MSGTIVIESRSYGSVFSQVIADEFPNATAIKDGIRFIQQTMPEQRQVEHWGPDLGELIVTIMGSGAGGMLAVYGVRLIDRITAKARERDHLPKLEIRVIYDARTKKSFRLPSEAEQAKRFLQGDDVADSTNRLKS